MGFRILLFSGLLLHKVVWEIWKRKYPGAVKKQKVSALKRILKFAKIGFLIFLLLQALFLDILPIRNLHLAFTYLGFALFILGLGISIAGRIRLGENWTDVEDQQVLPNQILVTSGLYQVIRHPIYTGDVLLVIGIELALNSWLFLLGLLIAAVVVRQAMQEEKLLMNAFPEYRNYCLRTKRFIPFIV